MRLLFGQTAIGNAYGTETGTLADHLGTRRTARCLWTIRKRRDRVSRLRLWTGEGGLVPLPARIAGAHNPRCAIP